ncbi:MAG: hypothetical protein ACRC62_21990, partial [Microcoleus sp.]
TVNCQRSTINYEGGHGGTFRPQTLRCYARYQRYRYARLRQRAGYACEFEVEPYKSIASGDARTTTINYQLSTLNYYPIGAPSH